MYKRQLQQKAIELGLRQRERPLELDGVHGREDREDLGKLMRDAVERDATLLHALEERGLGLGGGAIDLVGEQEVGEDRPLGEPEGAVLGLEDVGACLLYTSRCV